MKLHGFFSMIFHASLNQGEDGEFIASCDDPAVVAHGLSPQNALDNLRHEILYCIELCPCSAAEDDYVELSVSR